MKIKYKCNKCNMGCRIKVNTNVFYFPPPECCMNVMVKPKWEKVEK